MEKNMHGNINVCRYINTISDGFARDNVDFANKHGKSLPFRPFAYLVVYVNWLVRLPFRVIRKIGTLYKK